MIIRPNFCVVLLESLQRAVSVTLIHKYAKTFDKFKLEFGIVRIKLCKIDMLRIFYLMLKNDKSIWIIPKAGNISVLCNRRLNATAGCKKAKHRCISIVEAPVRQCVCPVHMQQLIDFHICILVSKARTLVRSNRGP